MCNPRIFQFGVKGKNIKSSPKMVICLCKILKDMSLDEVGEVLKGSFGGEHTLASTIAQHCTLSSIQYKYCNLQNRPVMFNAMAPTILDAFGLVHNIIISNVGTTYTTLTA